MSIPRSPEEALALLARWSPTHIRLGLDRIEAALESLGHPERRFRVLHVAGTNGKGSTCAFSDSVLRASGFHVGLYTSPHLVRVHERIAVGGEAISDRALGEALGAVLEACPEAPETLTYFELLTLAALWHFAREKVDFAVLETGLGGRLDATTAAGACVTGITSIDFDHREWLGHTLGEIATEKAGIFLPGVPAVSCVQQPEAAFALEQAASRVGAPLLWENRDFHLTASERGFTYHGPRRSLEGLRFPLRGAHQKQNAAVALACLEQLEAAIPEQAFRSGLASTRWPGRLEERGDGPKVVLDGAHNPAAARALAAAMRELYPGRRLHLVFGVLADKEWQPILEALLPSCATAHLTPLDSPRSLSPERYLEVARSLCPRTEAHGSPGAAFLAARAIASEPDVILCAGSLFLVGAIEGLLGALHHST